MTEVRTYGPVEEFAGRVYLAEGGGGGALRTLYFQPFATIEQVIQAIADEDETNHLVGAATEVINAAVYALKRISNIGGFVAPRGIFVPFSAFAQWDLSSISAIFDGMGANVTTSTRSALVEFSERQGVLIAEQGGVGVIGRSGKLLVIQRGALDRLYAFQRRYSSSFTLGVSLAPSIDKLRAEKIAYLGKATMIRLIIYMQRVIDIDLDDYPPEIFQLLTPTTLTNIALFSTVPAERYVRRVN